MPPELEDEHVVAICQMLADHQVRYVIIGGAAARLHGTGHVTVDIEICPERSRDNLARLADALNAMGTRLRVEGEPEGVPFPAHGDLLRQMTTLTLLTRHGPLDLCFEPAGFSRGYEDLVEHSVVITLAETALPVAALEDVVASKGRPVVPRTSSVSPPWKLTSGGGLHRTCWNHGPSRAITRTDEPHAPVVPALSSRLPHQQ